MIIGGVIAALVAASLLFVGITYNRLVGLRNNADNSWAQIDVQLRQRHDLVPALVEAVGGYAAHERGTLERVSAARGSAVAQQSADPATRSAAEGTLAGQVRGLMILAEQYPDLKASDNFAALQRSLTEIEEKIAITRRVYNDTVETLNTAVQVFPPNLVASAFGFKAKRFFDAPAGSDLAPAVSLPSPGARSGN